MSDNDFLAVHDGDHHADDALGVAIMQCVKPRLRVMRTRNPRDYSRCAARIDVGGKYNPDTDDFDHHQEGGAGARLNGVQYAASGLVWGRYGVQICGDLEVADLVDSDFIQAVDAEDTGQCTWREPDETGLAPFTFTRAVEAFNVRCDMERGPDSRLRAFRFAVDYCRKTLELQIGLARTSVSLRDPILGIAQPHDKVLCFDDDIPWQYTVCKYLPDALFVVYPRSNKSWAVRAVPLTPTSFRLRRSLPVAWCGKSGPELVAASGVADATFCHIAGFIAITKTCASALALAERALPLL